MGRALSKKSQLIIKLYERGYRADECGNIISPRGVKRKLIVHQGGYYVFSATRSLKVYAHRFVAYQLYGRKALRRSQVVRHMDDNRLNNSFKNLKLGTQSQNMMDKSEEMRKRQAQRMHEGRKAKKLMKESL